MELALIGLQGAGKTTLLHAITRGPRGGPVATVPLPDPRLDQLAAHFRPLRTIYPEATFHDLPPWPEGGRPFSPEASHLLSRAEALVMVIRAFRRPDVPHPRGEVDPERDFQELSLEMAYRDLDVVSRRLEKVAKAAASARPTERESAQRELKALQRAKATLEAERPLRQEGLTPEERKLLSPFALLTLRPLLIAINADDPVIGTEISQALASRYGGEATTFVPICAQMELELAQMPQEEADAFRQELGLPPEGMGAFLRSVLEVTGTVTFYTVVGEECRAWPVPRGTTALEAASKIHSDMARGFVRAEVIPWHQLLEVGTLQEAKARGLLRTEGKGYVVQDGDVIHILFH